jgi:hypothetical protein
LRVGGSRVSCSGLGLRVQGFGLTRLVHCAVFIHSPLDSRY